VNTVINLRVLAPRIWLVNYVSITMMIMKINALLYHVIIYCLTALAIIKKSTKLEPVTSNSNQ
jgi:hypothetical protein